MDRAASGPELTRDAGGFHLSSLRLVAADESASVIFGAVACLVLLSAALFVNLSYGAVILYAFPVAMAVWLFGRWIGVSVASFAVLGTVLIGLVGHRGADALPVAIPALLLVTAVSIAASEGARRSENLVDLLNTKERRHRQMLETMTKVSQELVASKRWEAIAGHSLASLTRDLELDAAWMYRRGAEGTRDNVMSLLAFTGDQPARQVVSVGEGGLGEVARTGKPLRAESAQSLRVLHPEIKESNLEDGIEARLVLPVFVKGMVSGVVLLGTRTPRNWTTEEIGIASAIVNQLGLAMENASAYRSTIEALVRMEEISQMKSDFLKTVSHELRTPLTVLIGYIDMMEDGSLGAVPEGWIQPMEQLKLKVGQLNRLVQMMLEASRAEGPTLDLNLEDIDLTSTVRHAVDAQRSDADLSGHQLELHLPNRDLLVRCDRDKLLVVLRNLVENAVKYSPPGSLVEIGLAPSETAVLVWVADRGMGVPDAEKKHIFEQFHRIHNQQTAAIGGTGLGLFIVRQLVEVQGGQVSVTDREGGGAMFSFTLPFRPFVGESAGEDDADGQGRRKHDHNLTGWGTS